MLSFWDRDPPLPRAKYCKRHRWILQISSLKCLCIFRDISSFFPFFASILMESLLHLSYSNPVNAMQIPSPTFCMLPPCLALCHGPSIPLSDIPTSHTLAVLSAFRICTLQIAREGLPSHLSFSSFSASKNTL